MTNLLKLAAQPFDFEFKLEHCALLVIDMQNDFCSEGGFVSQKGFDISHTQRAIEPISQLLKVLRETPITVIHTREGHRSDLSDCPNHKLKRSRFMGAEIGSQGPLGKLLERGSNSHDFVEDLQPYPHEAVIDKSGKDAFIGTDLDLILRNQKITQLIFTGVTTECCVHSSLRHANDLGYECLLLEDCCASYIPEFHSTSVDIVAAIFGYVAHSSQLIQMASQII